MDPVGPEKSPSTRLYQCVIYLAPGDYHGFHSPTEFNVKIRKHFSGNLLSVSPSVVRKIHNLFAINERVVYKGHWKENLFFSYSAVGATNVGSIRVSGDPDLKTNCKSDPKGCCSTMQFGDLKYDRGQYLGEFNLGSTIVLLFEGPRDLKFCIKEGQKVQMGQKIALFNA